MVKLHKKFGAFFHFPPRGNRPTQAGNTKYAEFSGKKQKISKRNEYGKITNAFAQKTRRRVERFFHETTEFM